MSAVAGADAKLLLAQNLGIYSTGPRGCQGIGTPRLRLPCVLRWSRGADAPLWTEALSLTRPPAQTTKEPNIKSLPLIDVQLLLHTPVHPQVVLSKQAIKRILIINSHKVTKRAKNC